MSRDFEKSPGHASLEELRNYWRAASKRATMERAKHLGVRRTGNGYPWLAIWRAEGLAPPPARQWEELKRTHLTAVDLAGILGCSTRTARRKRLEKPDADFPDPIEFGPRIILWRAAQITAWQFGRPVPVYKRLYTGIRAVVEAETPNSNARSDELYSRASVFNPFSEITAETNGLRKK